MHLIPSDTESLDISNLKSQNNDESVLQVISLLINNNLNHLLQVDLSFNKIKALGHRSRNLFINNLNSQHLIYLNISHNSIKFITGDAFHSLKRLKILDLSYNSIKFIDERAFNGLDSLQSLHLQHNSVSIIYLDLFQSLLNVRVSCLCDGWPSVSSSFSFLFALNHILFVSLSPLLNVLPLFVNASANEMREHCKQISWLQ